MGGLIPVELHSQGSSTCDKIADQSLLRCVNDNNNNNNNNNNNSNSNSNSNNNNNNNN